MNQAKHKTNKQASKQNKQSSKQASKQTHRKYTNQQNTIRQ